MANEYYPRLTSLVPLDALPDALGFVKDGITNLFSGLYFKDLQYSVSRRGDAAQYSLSIVTAKPLEVEILGTGMFLLLNPDTSTPHSSFPVTLRYEWGILTWVRAFDPSTFSFQPGDFYKLALSATGMTERQLLERALDAFVPGANLLDKVNQFIDDANTLYGTTVGHQSGTDPLGDALAAVGTATNLQASIMTFSLYVQQIDLSQTEENLEKFFAGLFPGGSLKDYFTKLITPRIDATLHVSAGIRFPPTMLKPTDSSPYSLLKIDAGDFSFSTESGIGYDDNLTATLTPSEIGNTGFKIDFSKVRLDLSRKKNIPEATADGRSDDFVGVFFERAAITLPPFFQQKDNLSTAEIVATNCLIGTGGGLTGRIALQAKATTPAGTAALVKAQFGSGFELGLSEVHVKFKQNVITESGLTGFMKIPGFNDAAGNPAEIKIVATVDSKGDFSVTASEDQGIRALRIPEVFELDVKSLSVGRKDNRWFVAISGTLEFLGVVGEFLADKVDIKKLIIYDNGDFALEGGKITLPRAVSLNVGPVTLSVSGIGFGTYEREHGGHHRHYKFFDFDAAVNVNPGGVDVQGSGIKFYYTVDDAQTGLPPDRFLRIQSIAVDLVIPGSASRESAVVLIKGYLSMREATPPAGGTEYAGAISLELPKAKIAGAAAMRLNPTEPAFLIDASLELSSPIVIGSTIFGIWGFRLLLGLHYVASKDYIGLDESDPWWKYYLKKVPPDNLEGIQASKFAPRPGFSVGGGLSVGTLDAGVTFSAKVFLLLSLPDVFLIQGQAQILKGRVMPTDNPPFFVMIAFTKNSIEAAFGVHYAIPDAEENEPGGIVTVDAITEMGFFWGSSSAWYVNIGKDSPESERVHVRLLKIVDAYFYLMMSGAGIRAGAGASYGLKKSFGPLKAELRAYLDTAGHLSFRPSKIGASIRIGGNVSLSIFGFGFGISAAASLAAEGTKPFTITGSLEVCVRVLRKDRCAKFEFTWTFNEDLDETEMPLFKADLHESGKALNMHTHETFELWTGASLPAPQDLDPYMIPLDSYIDIEFQKGVLPSTTVAAQYIGNSMGSNYTEYFAPQRGKNDRVRHEYLLDSAELLYYDGGWKPYNIYAAGTPPQLQPFITSNLTTLKQGAWQYQEPKRHNRLRVMAQSPLNYLSQGTGGHVIEDSGITPETIFCAPDPIKPVCVDFDEYPALALELDQLLFHEHVQFRVLGAGGAVISKADGGHTRALRLDAGSTLELFLTEPAAQVRLKIAAATDSAVVRFYKRVPVPPNGTEYTWDLAATRAVARGALTDVVYDDKTNPVEKIVIEAGECRIDPPLVCDTTLTNQAHDLEHFLDALAAHGQLADPVVDLCARDCKPWDGIFFNTSLYGPRVDPVYFHYETVAAAGNALHAQLTDWRGFSCAIQLTVVDGPASIDWKKIVHIHHIRADTNPVPGVNYAFLIDADLQTAGGIVHITLRGTSCYPITTCGYPGSAQPGAMTPETGALGDLLHTLAENNRLTQPRVKLTPAEAALFGRIPAASPPASPATRRFDEKTWATSTGDATSLQLTFGALGTVTLDAQHTRPDFDFNNVTGFTNIRPALEGLKSGPNSGFTIDARMRDGGTVTFHGRAPFTTNVGQDIPPGRRRAVDWWPSGSTECALYLYEICQLDYPSVAFNDSIPTQSDVDAEVQSIVNAFQGSIAPLLRPNTYYALSITTRDVLYRDSSWSVLRTYPTPLSQKVFGFCTGGPLGHFGDYPADAEHKLATLLHYVDFATCYPNADGQMLNAKPLFYEKPKLLLFYLENYIPRMFCDWAWYGNLEGANAIFEVEVKDPAPDPALPNAAPVAAHWELSPLPIVSQDVVVLNNIIRHGTPCGPAITEIHPTTLYSTFPLDSLNLQPWRLYTAIFNLKFKKNSDANYVSKQLLTYGFRTSRYANFAEQIDSHQQSPLFEIRKAVTPEQLSVAATVLDGTMPKGDPLRQMFGDPFNRLIDGVLRFEPLDPPVTMEFNVVRDDATGRILGMLARSDEPLNDPKMPAADVASTVRLSVNGDPNYSALFSRDLSQAFVTNASMTIPDGATLDFTFEYKQWNGTQYAVVESVAVQVVLP